MYDQNKNDEQSLNEVKQDQQTSHPENSGNEWKDKYMRLLADFQNFQKRLEKDYAAMRKSIQVSFLLDIFTVMDNIQRALQAEAGEGSLRTGIELVRKDIVKILEKNQVRRIEALTLFDPLYHEAVAYVDGNGKESGTIVTVFEDGYMLDNVVIRPAKVTVAR